MPVVPLSPRSAQPRRKPLDAAQEPWVLMAAAAMDAQGKLVGNESGPLKVGASEGASSNGT